MAKEKQLNRFRAAVSKYGLAVGTDREAKEFENVMNLAELFVDAYNEAYHAANTFRQREFLLREGIEQLLEKANKGE